MMPTGWLMTTTKPGTIAETTVKFVDGQPVIGYCCVGRHRQPVAENEHLHNRTGKFIISLEYHTASADPGRSVRFSQETPFRKVLRRNRRTSRDRRKRMAALPQQGNRDRCGNARWLSSTRRYRERLHLDRKLQNPSGRQSDRNPIPRRAALCRQFQEYPGRKGPLREFNPILRPIFHRWRRTFVSSMYHPLPQTQNHQRIPDRRCRGVRGLSDCSSLKEWLALRSTLRSTKPIRSSRPTKP